MIENKKDWEFLYLGANIDSYGEASSIGSRKDRTSNYKSSKKGTRQMFAALECAVGRIAANEKLDDSWNEELEN